MHVLRIDPDRLDRVDLQALWGKSAADNGAAVRSLPPVSLPLRLQFNESRCEFHSRSCCAALQKQARVQDEALSAKMNAMQEQLSRLEQLLMRQQPAAAAAAGSSPKPGELGSVVGRLG